MKKLFLTLIVMFVLTIGMKAQIAISGIMANPGGTDSAYEYVQLIATQNINFANTNYTVIFNNNGTAQPKGWVTGGSTTYAFSLTSGTVTQGDVFYVGGNGKLIYGYGSTNISSANWIKVLRTAAAGDGGIGSGSSGGVLGNAGTSADGVAIFASNVSNIDSLTVPIDAVFFGTVIGSANPSTGGYTLPDNDLYITSQGTFGDGTNTYLAPDVATGAYIKFTGTFDVSTNKWSTGRSASTVTLSTTSALSDIATGITLYNPIPTITANTTGFNSSFGPIVPNSQSASSSFTVSGADLTANVSISVSAPFEIRTGTGVYSQNITLTQTGGLLGNQTIDVRFNPTAAGTFTDTITIASSGATTIKIAVSGQAVSAPSLGVNTASFNNNLGTVGVGVNSAIDTFEVNGVNLTGDITISVNLPFEVRTAGGTFSQSATVSPSSGTVSNAGIEIRFNSMSIGQFSDSIEISSPGAQTIKVFVSGETKSANIKFANTAKISGTEGKTATVIVKVVAEYQGMGTTSVSFGSAANRTAVSPTHFTFGGNNNVNFNSGMDTMDLEITLVDDNISGPRTRRGKFFIQSANNGATFSNDTIDIDIFENDYKYVKIAEIKQNNANFEPLGFDSLYAVSGVVYGYNTRNAGSGYSFTTIDNTGGIGNFAPASASTFGYVITEGDSITMRGRLTHFNGLSQLDFLDTIILHKSNAMLKSPVVVNNLSEATESDLITINKVKIVTPEPTWQGGTSGRNYRVYNTVTFDTFEIRILPVCPLVGQAIPTDEFSVIGIGGQFANRVPRNFGYQIFPRYLTDIILPDALGDFNLLTPANNTVLDLQGDPNQVVNITWEASVPASGVAAPTYEWMADPAGNFGTPLLKLPAGANTSLSLTFKQIADALPTVTVGSSVDVKWTVLATSGAETKFAVMDFNLKINRGALTSIKETTQNIARIYPNPASGVINIELKEKAERIVLTDVSGRVVYSHAVSAATHAINTENLNNGVYFVKIYTAEKQSIEKIVINK